jgi:hypothetical protein
MSDIPTAQHTLAATGSLARNASTLHEFTTSEPISLSLFAKAKALTRYIFDGFPLSDELKGYGHLFALFASGAAIGSTLYHVFRRYRENRAKVQLAIFHVIRMIESCPDLEARLNSPQELIKDIGFEVVRMVDIHLTKNEAAEAIAELKRKVWDYVDEQRAISITAKRQKSSPTKDQHSVHEYEKEQQLQILDINDVVELSGTSSVPSGIDTHEQLQQKTYEEDIDMKDVDHHSSVQISSSPHARSRSTSSSAKQTSSGQGRSTYTVPSSSESDKEYSPMPTPRASKHTVQPRYGLNYDEDDDRNEELYTGCLPNLSQKTSRTKQQQKTVPDKQYSMLQAATMRAFDPNALGNHPYESPVLSRPKAVKRPTTVKIQEPPNTLANKTRDPERGTWLAPIQEGFSPQETSPSSITHYRVAESRKYYNNVKSARKERRSIRDFFKQGDELEQLQQEQAQSPTPVVVDQEVDQEWPDVILTYSDSDNNADESAELVPPMSPLPSIDSPPSAPEISPPLPSPSSSESASELSSLVSSPELPQIPSSPLSDPPSSPPLSEAETPLKISTPFSSTSRAVRSKTPLNAPQTPTPARSTTPSRSSPIVLIKSPPKPITPSPPKKTRGHPRKFESSVMPDTPMPPTKKLGRPRKVVGEVQTPCKVRVETPGVRKSARKSGYQGAYTK